jgi:hypothetical protein
MINPYSPPASDLVPEPDGRAKIKARLARPATALIVMASIHSAMLSLIFVPAALTVLQGGSINDFLNFCISGFQLTMLIIIAVGAAKMGYLESLLMARIGAFLACLPFVSPFIILGIPFGIWSLKLLSETAVQDAFGKK